jgi:hypothetical protein
MTERIASAVMLIVAVYSGSWYAINDPSSPMVWLFLGLTIASIWTVHAVWTAPVFHEGDGE